MTHCILYVQKLIRNHSEQHPPCKRHLGAMSTACKRLPSMRETATGRHSEAPGFSCPNAPQQSDFRYKKGEFNHQSPMTASAMLTTYTALLQPPSSRAPLRQQGMRAQLSSIASLLDAPNSHRQLENHEQATRDKNLALGLLKQLRHRVPQEWVP